MKKSILLASSIFFLLVGSQISNAAEYAIDGSHSSVGFKIKHLMSKVSGNFKDFEGTFSFDEKKPQNFSGDFSIKTASVNTNETKRDEHLRSPDFFDSQKFPAMTFKSKKMTAAGKNKYTMEGDLTIRDKTLPTKFAVEYTGSGTDPWGNEKVGFSATSKINRKNFGIVWNKALDKGGFVLGDDVEIEIQVEAAKKAPATAQASPAAHK